MKAEENRLDLLNQFYRAPDQTLFNQKVLCAVLDCSEALAERDRWRGTGARFIKIGRTVRYKKRDILDYLEQQESE